MRRDLVWGKYARILDSLPVYRVRVVRFACCRLSGTIAPLQHAIAREDFDNSQGSGAMILLHNQRLSGTVPHMNPMPVPVMALSLARNEFTGIIGPGFATFDTDQLRTLLLHGNRFCCGIYPFNNSTNLGSGSFSLPNMSKWKINTHQGHEEDASTRSWPEIAVRSAVKALQTKYPKDLHNTALSFTGILRACIRWC